MMHLNFGIVQIKTVVFALVADKMTKETVLTLIKWPINGYFLYHLIGIIATKCHIYIYIVKMNTPPS